MRPDCATVTGMAPSRERGRRVPALIVHGGAGAATADRDELRDGMQAAIEAGWTALAGGGTALDAVEHAVRVLEDHPRFNAGHGSVLTEDGAVEMDASIMEGDRLECGAVAAVSRVANPITLARHVLEERRHVLLAGEGAHAFAEAVGVPACDPASLITERQRARLGLRAKGTVGAVAPGAGGGGGPSTATAPSRRPRRPAAWSASGPAAWATAR
jgi:beta-aspartyl-peptidase (threonine type)